MFPNDCPLVGLRVEVEDLTPYLEPGTKVQAYTRFLDKDWSYAGGLVLPGAAHDLLHTVTADVVAAWQWEDRRAILREMQRNDRFARKYAKEHRHD